MRMLLGFGSLTLMWLFCGTSSALPKETALPKNLPRSVKGHGMTIENAKTAALKQAVQELTDVMKSHDPPLQAFVVSEKYVSEKALVDAGQAGEDVKEKVKDEDITFKTWIVTYRSDSDWWRDVVRRDEAAQRKARAEQRQTLGAQVIVGLACLLLAGFGYVRLDEYTQRRYTAWLRLAGAGVAGTLVAGWWWVFLNHRW